jgi:hypothetical protein
MTEIPHFKKGATIIKLHTTVTYSNVCGNFMSHCRSNKSTENTYLTGGKPYMKCNYTKFL